MEITKRFTLLGALVCMILGLSCGSRPKLIEEDELKTIISEMMITDAIIATKNENQAYDTLDTYATILKRHGYTRDDFSYTIGEMAGRKSNPLNNVFEQIKAQLTGEASNADANFAELRRYDSLARATFADTIYVSDRRLRPPFAGQKIEIDSVLREGEYSVQFDYKTHASYDLGIRIFTITALNSDSSKNLRASNMLNRTSTYTNVRQRIRVPTGDGFKGLRVTFNDPKAEKVFKGPDTTVIRNVRLVYDPPLMEARKLLINRALKLHLDDTQQPTHDSDEQLWTFRRPQDSLAVDTIAGRQAGTPSAADFRR